MVRGGEVDRGRSVPTFEKQCSLKKEQQWDPLYLEPQAGPTP
ncbi:hypothetical protein COLO4_12409 [Corchorus olitorius]|uniref:Uncharacterized protein n=1 Tax=Corchorus olitorius TaxID=93759 RepID=A0A1R3K182_9ROSI|nr:hypothetical protein COLO4_12409 [Corchorus olitorius]